LLSLTTKIMSTKPLKDSGVVTGVDSHSNHYESISEYSHSSGLLHEGENIEEFEYSNRLKEMEDVWQLESQTYFDSLKWYMRPSRHIIYTILSIHVLALTCSAAPLMMLMLENICTSYPKHNLPPYECDRPEAQKVLSNVQSTLAIIAGVLGFILSGKYGQLSDRYGRVFVFKIFSIIQLAYISGLLIYFTYYGDQFHEIILILIASIGFLSGGIMSLVATGNSYLNDIISAKERTISISWLMSIVYSTLGFGPLIGSFLVKVSRGNNLAPLFGSLACTLTSTILVYTMMIETKHPEARRLAQELYEKKRDKHLKYHENRILNFLMIQSENLMSFFYPIKRLWIPKTYIKKSSIPRYNVVTLILVDVFNMGCTVGTMHVMILYCMLRYKWTSVEIGYYMSIGGFGRAAVLLLIAPTFLKVLEKNFGYKILTDSVDKLDKTSIMISLCFVLMSSLSIFLFDSSFGIYLSGVLQSLSGLVSPTIQSSVIKYSNKTDAGEMFGAMALVRHAAMLVMPVFFLQIYSHTVDFNPVFFNFVPFVGSVLTLSLTTFVLRVYEEDNETDTDVEN